MLFLFLFLLLSYAVHDSVIPLLVNITRAIKTVFPFHYANALPSLVFLFSSVFVCDIQIKQFFATIFVLILNLYYCMEIHCLRLQNYFIFFIAEPKY